MPNKECDFCGKTPCIQPEICANYRGWQAANDEMVTNGMEKQFLPKDTTESL